MVLRLVVLCGLPGAGKSSVGRLLERDSRQFRFWPEIGGLRHAEFGGYPWDKDPAFDQKIMDDEFERDQRLANGQHIPIVETWHFGNMAFARIRSPSVFNSYGSRLTGTMDFFRPTMLLLDVPVPFSLERSRYPNNQVAKRFLEALQQNISEIAAHYSVPSFTVDACRPSTEVLEDCRQRIRDLHDLKP